MLTQEWYKSTMRQAAEENGRKMLYPSFFGQVEAILTHGTIEEQITEIKFAHDALEEVWQDESIPWEKKTPDNGGREIIHLDDNTLAEMNATIMREG